MDIEEDPEINLSVPLRPIYEELICPVCFNAIQECFVTTCGHNFCKACIAECLNRKHSCPCCNHATTKAQTIKNHHFDRLLKIIESHKDDASKKYFESLIANQAANKNGDNNNVPLNSKLSPIETVFHKYMKKSLLEYENYYSEMKHKFEGNSKEIKETYDNKMNKAKKKYQNRENVLNSKLAKYTKICEEKQQALAASFNTAVSLLQDSYENYMKDFAPAPQLLPVTVTVVVPKKKYRMKLTIKPTDNARDVKAALQLDMANTGDQITAFSNDNFFTIFRPLGSKGEETAVYDENRPLIQYKIEPGSELILQGDLKLKSDMPKECLTANFEKDMVMDYFTCRDCKFNWICKTCAQNCHAGHDTVIYIAKHNPTWACCYCVKNNKCKIINQKTKPK